MKRSFLLLVLGFCLCDLATAQDAGFRNAFGPKFNPGIGIRHNPPPEAGRDAIHRWNTVAINATGLDHTPVELGDPRIFGEQLGPCRAARAMAIIHMAMYDALSVVLDNRNTFTDVPKPHGPISANAAIAQGARDTLVALYPSQTQTFDNFLAQDLAPISNAAERANGIALGHTIAAAILLERSTDGSQVPEPRVGNGPGEHATSDLVGHWRQDPISLIPLALGAHWGECRPFILRSADQFRTPKPPKLTSKEYEKAFNEAKRLGGDGIHTPTERTAEQTFIGTFWAYDGTPSLCAPPRLYNQIAVTIADQTHLSGLELAQLLALSNVAMADAGFAAWESKFYWDFWRPIGGIRESDVGTGPSGLGDGNPHTVGDPGFMPLGAPASNLTGPNFTPPFPAYPSGHATFGGALFETIRRFYHTDHIAFTFTSDEFNGFTHANNGMVRPNMPRTFSKLSEAEEENGQSRIYLGIHWSFDKEEGIKQGQKVAQYVYDHAFKGHH